MSTMSQSECSQNVMVANGSSSGGESGGHVNGTTVLTANVAEGSEKPSVECMQFVPTLTRNDVPLLFREAHVESGFRALGYPWKCYLMSVFQLHNESMNVWTHLIASYLMLAKLFKFSEEIDFINDAYTWPLMAGLICGTSLYAASAGAHCLQSKSELVHYTAFMLDYAGIGIYGLGSVIVHLAYCSEENFYEAVDSWFVPLGCVIAFSICFCCTIAKVIYKRPYPFARKIWQMAPVGGIYALLISPIVHRLNACYMYGEDCNDSIPLHITQICWFFTSGLFFASDFPQRQFPGKCDHFFHSHQLFHIAIMMSTLTQMDGVFVDLQTRRHILEKRPQPTFLSAFGPVIFTMLAEFITIVIFHFLIRGWLQEEAKQKQDEKMKTQ